MQASNKAVSWKDLTAIVDGKLDAIKITNEDRRDGCREVRAEGLVEGESSSGRGVKVDKAQAANSDKLGVAREEFLDGSEREAGKDSQDEVAASTRKSRGPEGVASRGSQGRHQVEGGGLLDEDEVRFGLPDDGRQASEVGPLVGVKGKEGDDGGRRLPVIPRERSTLEYLEKESLQSPQGETSFVTP